MHISDEVALEVLRRANAGGTGFITNIAGVGNIDITPEEAWLMAQGKEVEVGASHADMSVAMFLEWRAFLKNPQCCGFNKNGQRCARWIPQEECDDYACFVPGQMFCSQHEWQRNDSEDEVENESEI